MFGYYIALYFKTMHGVHGLKFPMRCDAMRLRSDANAMGRLSRRTMCQWGAIRWCQLGSGCRYDTMSNMMALWLIRCNMMAMEGITNEDQVTRWDYIKTPRPVLSVMRRCNGDPGTCCSLRRWGTMTAPSGTMTPEVLSKRCDAIHYDRRRWFHAA